MQSYPLALPDLELTIEGVTRTSYLLASSLRVNQILGSQVDTCGFALKQPETWRASIASIKPSVGDEVVITRAGGSTKLFAGYVTDVRESRIAYKTVRWDIEATDYTQLLQRRYVVGLAGAADGIAATLAGSTVSEIAQSIVRAYAPDIDPDAGTVESTTHTVPSIAFNYELVRDAIDRLAKLIEWEWYVDYDKRLVFFDPTGASYAAAQQITDTSNNFMDLSITPQLDQVRNRIWVRGGEALSAEVVEEFKANGDIREFRLHNSDLSEISMTIDGVPHTIGIEGQALEETVAFLLSQTTGPGAVAVVRNASHTTTVADLATVEFRYKYKYPIAVMVEDTASQTSHGVRESSIVNASLRTISEARALGQLELARWSEPITDIRFHSYVPGWQIGTTVTINVTEAGTGRTFNGTALIQVQRITARGAQRLRFDIECRSARFNLIDYFRQLLKAAPIPGPKGSPADLDVITTLSPNSVILIDGSPAATTQGTSFYVAPDWGTGTTPYIRPEYWVVDPDAF